MTRRPFFAMDFNRHGHEIAFAPRQERSGGRSWMVGHSEVNRRSPPTGYRYRYATLTPLFARRYGMTRKTAMLESVPLGVTTWSLPLVAPAGTVVVISEPETT
jgi:hypothetical protein